MPCRPARSNTSSIHAYILAVGHVTPAALLSLPPEGGRTRGKGEGVNEAASRRLVTYSDFRSPGPSECRGDDGTKGGPRRAARAVLLGALFLSLSPRSVKGRENPESHGDEQGRALKLSPGQDRRPRYSRRDRTDRRGLLVSTWFTSRAAQKPRKRRLP